jgi:hypothetical protein
VSVALAVIFAFVGGFAACLSIVMLASGRATRTLADDPRVPCVTCRVRRWLLRALPLRAPRGVWLEEVGRE